MDNLNNQDLLAKIAELTQAILLELNRQVFDEVNSLIKKRLYYISEYLSCGYQDADFYKQVARLEKENELIMDVLHDEQKKIKKALVNLVHVSRYISF